ncbi:transposable element Tcb1 transposase [Trichonephila clavipes]|nr:transposable element Tcb1 transposase [Trichonephila clavipes]
METEWSARHISRSDFAVRKFWNLWTEEMSFTRRPGSGHPRQTSCREDHHIIRHARVELITSLAAVQSQAAPSPRTPNHRNAPG